MPKYSIDELLHELTTEIDVISACRDENKFVPAIVESATTRIEMLRAAQTELRRLHAFMTDALEIDRMSTPCSDDACDEPAHRKSNELRELVERFEGDAP